MTYQEALDQVTASHRDQMEVDLETARGRYGEARAHLAAAERQLHMLEGLPLGPAQSSQLPSKRPPLKVAATTRPSRCTRPCDGF